MISSPNYLTEESNINTITVDISGNEDYTSINHAIENATIGSIIYVQSGIYQEKIKINKSIKLIAIDRNTTIIKPANNKTDVVINVTADNVQISNFTILENEDITTQNNQVINKTTINIVSNSNNISKNIFQENIGICIKLKKSINNKIILNTFLENSICISIDEESNNNEIFYNNFFESRKFNVEDNGKNNIWYNQTFTMGNYWSDYKGEDKNSDGIGDTAYKFQGDNKDLYPLMKPFEKKLSLKEFTIDRENVIFMLTISMIVVIIFLLPIAYIWYRIRKRDYGE